MLWEILQENLHKILWEMLWEILREILQEVLWEILRTYPQTNFDANFENMQVIWIYLILTCKIKIFIPEAIF